MGIARGPNVINDGLVFGYDTGYGLDNFKPTRFYKGKPAVNILNNGDNFGNWNKTKNSGSDPTVTSDVATGPFENTLADRLFLPNDGSYPRLYQYFTPASTATHTFSVWLKSETPGQGVFVGAFRNSPWALPSYTTFTITNEWVNYTLAINPLDTSSHQIYIGSHDSHKGKEFLIYGAQLETGSSRSTFVDGTRSNTASLIDLKRTASMTVANISFDSTGQPDYDGSNDYLRTTLNGVDLNSGCTIEGVLRRNSTPTAWRTFFNLKPTGSNTPFFEFRSGANTQEIYSDYYNGSADHNTPAGALTTGEFCHAVSCYDGNGNIKMYLNGSLVGTKTGVPAFALGTSPVLSVGIAYSNDRYTDISAPVVKVYNAVLSATQVEQNYKAYKNRFNI